MIEVVPGSNPITLPMPALPEIAATKNVKKGYVLKFFSFSALSVAVANIFGALGFLTTLCSADTCNSDSSRINWAGINQISNEMGWSLPYPEIGIPDYIAVGFKFTITHCRFRAKVMRQFDERPLRSTNYGKWQSQARNTFQD